MDRLLDQLRFHPGMALVAVSIFAAGVVLVGLKRTERPGLLPKMLGLALLAGAFGGARSVRHLFEVFHAMALTGSAGYGALGAGLGECDGALLLGLAPALLTLGLGLAFARGAV